MDASPESKIHKLTLGECYQQGYKDGRLAFHDSALWETLSRPKRAAYDRGNVAGRANPSRC
jgi:hypothetical protein